MHVRTRMIHECDVIAAGDVVAYVGTHEAMRDVWGLSGTCTHVVQSYARVEYENGVDVHVHVSCLVHMDYYLSEVCA